MGEPLVNSRTALAVLVLGICFVVAVFDLWAVTVYGPQATLSSAAYNASRQYPIIPFAVGVLVGHLFWS